MEQSRNVCVCVCMFSQTFGIPNKLPADFKMNKDKQNFQFEVISNFKVMINFITHLVLFLFFKKTESNSDKSFTFNH